MATIDSLVEATIVGDNDLLLIDQGGEGKKLKKGNLKIDADNVLDANGRSVQDFIDSQTFANVDAMLAFGGLQVGQRYSTGGTTWEYLGGGNTLDKFKKLNKAIEEVKGVTLYPYDEGVSLAVGDVIPVGVTSLTVNSSVYYTATPISGEVSRIDLNNLRVTAGGQTSNLLKISTDTKSKSTQSDYRTLLRNFDISDKKQGSPWFVKTNDDTYQFYTPLGVGGESCMVRLSKAESAFDVGTNVGDRPFRISVRRHSNASVYGNMAYSDSYPIGAWSDSGAFKRSNVSGNRLKYRFKGSSVRTTLLANTSNGGIAWIRIDGSSDACNLLPKDASGNAYINTGIGTGSIQTMVANELDAGWHEIEIIVSGQTTTSDTYVYVENTIGVRWYGAPVNRTPKTDATYVENILFTIDGGVSAVTYAYNCSLLSPPPTPVGSKFIGDIHGFERRTSAVMYVDNTAYDMINDISIGQLGSSKTKITVMQTTDVFHPDSLINPVARATSIFIFSNEGLSIKHKWEILQGMYCIKGYTSMWTCSGGALGGDPNVPNGWNNQVLYVGGYNYPLTSNDDSYTPLYQTSQIVFWGTKPTPAETSRDANAGKYACLVNVDDYFQSLGGEFGYDNTSFIGLHIWDRANYNKMYLNAMSQKILNVGDTISGGCTVEHYYNQQMSSIMSSNN